MFINSSFHHVDVLYASIRVRQLTKSSACFIFPVDLFYGFDLNCRNIQIVVSEQFTYHVL